MDTQNYLSIMESNDLSRVPEKDHGTSTEIKVYGDWVLDDIAILNITDLNDNKIATCSTTSLHDENNILQNQCKQVESRYNILQKENERLSHMLTQEKCRAEKFHKKLQYIHDNHAIFDRLKQAYLNMKYNESVTRPMVEITEKACQSETFLHTSTSEKCTDIKATKSNLYLPIGPGYVTVQQSDLDAVKDTVATIKEFIRSRSETSFGLGAQREAKYRKDIADLFRENIDLKQKVEDLEVELDDLTKKFVSSKPQKENSMLKRIIAKLEQKIKYLETDLSSDESTTNLNDKEQKLVEIIKTKYHEKIQQKLEKVIVLERKNSTPFVTARSLAPCDNESVYSFRSCEGEEIKEDVLVNDNKTLEIIHAAQHV